VGYSPLLFFVSQNSAGLYIYKDASTMLAIRTKPTKRGGTTSIAQISLRVNPFGRLQLLPDNPWARESCIPETIICTSRNKMTAPT